MSTEIAAQDRKQFYHTEEVLNSDKFFLVGRGGHGNFHGANRALRQYVAQSAAAYVATPRKDRAVLSIRMFDHDPMFQNLIFVTPRDYVLPRLEKDAEINSQKQAESQVKQHGQQKRLLSQTRTKSIMEKHGSVANIRQYPSGVYIEVGRDWAIDIVDHLLREQAHEIRKMRSQSESVAKGATTLHADSQAAQVEETIGMIDPADIGLSIETAEVVQMVENLQEEAHADRARALASPDMMEAVDGLTALMKSERAREKDDTPAKNEQNAVYATGTNIKGGHESAEHTGIKQSAISVENQSDNPGRLAVESQKDSFAVSGGDIPRNFPDDLHFVCGCVGFSVLDNKEFLQLIEDYYEDHLVEDSNFRQEFNLGSSRLAVRRHVKGILSRSQKYAKQQGKNSFRMWTAQRDDANGGRLQRLSEEFWSKSMLMEITSNIALLKQRLESPLRSALQNLKARKQEDKPKPPVAGPVPDSAGKSHKPGQPSQNRGEKLVTSDVSTSKRRALDLANDWRDMLPCGSFDCHDLGEIPGGWIFCRERALQDLLSTRDKISIIVPDRTFKGSRSCPENHFAWDVCNLWRSGLSAKRFVCWLDASSRDSIYSDYTRLTRIIRQEVGNEGEKRQKYDFEEAARLFYESVRDVRNGAEFFLAFTSVVDPLTFSEWAKPEYWWQDDGTLLNNLVVAIVPMDSGCRWTPSSVHGPVEVHTVHRIPDKQEGEEKAWWHELPLPNLPPIFSVGITQEVMGSVRHALDVDGSVVALLGEKGRDESLSSSLANQFVRKWMMDDPTSRFSLWISAEDKSSLVKSYLKAISTLTRVKPIDDSPKTLLPLDLAKDLMGLLMQMRKHAPSFQFIIVFADVPQSSRIDEFFFPPSTDWWNSRGRFVLTSQGPESFRVRVGDSDTLRKIPSVKVG